MRFISLHSILGLVVTAASEGRLYGINSSSTTDLSDSHLHTGLYRGPQDSAERIETYNEGAVVCVQTQVPVDAEAPVRVDHSVQSDNYYTATQNTQVMSTAGSCGQVTEKATALGHVQINETTAIAQSPQTTSTTLDYARVTNAAGSVDHIQVVNDALPADNTVAKTALAIETALTSQPALAVQTEPSYGLDIQQSSLADGYGCGSQSPDSSLLSRGALFARQESSVSASTGIDESVDTSLDPTAGPSYPTLSPSTVTIGEIIIIPGPSGPIPATIGDDGTPHPVITDSASISSNSTSVDSSPTNSTSTSVSGSEPEATANVAYAPSENVAKKSGVECSLAGVVGLALIVIIGL